MDQVSFVGLQLLMRSIFKKFSPAQLYSHETKLFQLWRSYIPFKTLNAVEHWRKVKVFVNTHWIISTKFFHWMQICAKSRLHKHLQVCTTIFTATDKKHIVYTHKQMIEYWQLTNKNTETYIHKYTHTITHIQTHKYINPLTHTYSHQKFSVKPK